MPDFVRNFMKGSRLKPAPIHSAHPEDLQFLHEGTMKHFSRDSRFHASQVFEKLNKQLIAPMKPVFENAGIPRYWWGAHVLAEMMLDRVLMKQHPEQMLDFYRDLDTVQLQTVSDYLEMAGLTEHNPFFERLNRFRELRYLLRYVEDETLVYSLGRVYQYAGVSPEWDARQSRLVTAIIPELELEVEKLMPDVMEEMQ